jgi:hypothetical protein
VLELFRDATAAVLSVLGGDSLLRGTVSCKVNIEHGVQLAGLDENMVVDRDVATIAKTHNPKVGDTLAHPDGNYILDAVIEDKEAYARFVVLKV